MTRRLYKNRRIGFYAIKSLTAAIHTIPTITVTDKLFVHTAAARVGTMAMRTLQSMASKDSSSLMKLSTISAVKIQTGTYESHLIATFGSLIFLITINGIILGRKVTAVHPKMIHKKEI